MKSLAEAWADLERAWRDLVLSIVDALPRWMR